MRKRNRYRSKHTWFYEYKCNDCPSHAEKRQKASLTVEEANGQLPAGPRSQLRRQVPELSYRSGDESVRYFAFRPRSVETISLYKIL